MSAIEVEGRTPVAVVTGHTSGLGLAITVMLLSAGWKVHGWSDTEEFDIVPFVGDVAGAMFTHHKVDVQWIEEMGDAIIEMGGDDLDSLQIDALINCAGVNYLAPFESFEFGQWERLIDINAKALAMSARICLPFLANQADPLMGGTILNIISNAAHVPMTHSLAYNASKGAALMVTKQMARELFESHGVTVFSISPNKMHGTKMSREIEEAVPALRGWTEEEAAAYQAAALPTGMETPPHMVAEFIAFLLSKKERHIFLHGCDIPYGA